MKPKPLTAHQLLHIYNTTSQYCEDELAGDTSFLEWVIDLHRPHLHTDIPKLHQEYLSYLAWQKDTAIQDGLTHQS